MHGSMTITSTGLARVFWESSLTTSQEYPERQSTSAGSPLPSIVTEVPCLICMILSYYDCPSPSRAEAIQLKEVKPYDYEPISLDCLITIYVCFCFVILMKATVK